MSKCNHDGHWGGIGTNIISNGQQIIIVHNLFCKKCGFSKTNQISIPIPEPSKIARPNMVMKPKGN